MFQHSQHIREYQYLTGKYGAHKPRSRPGLNRMVIDEDCVEYAYRPQNNMPSVHKSPSQYAGPPKAGMYPPASDAFEIDPPHPPAQAWSFRVPSPPRLVIPPLPVGSNGLPDLQMINGPSHDFESSGFANSEFLQTVTYGNFIKGNAMLDWRYEERRNAQQILPFLHLGPSSTAKNQAYLAREGITMVLAVRNTLSAHARLLGSKVAENMGLDVEAIDVAGNMELIAAFPRGIEIINTHLTKVYQQQQQLKNTGNGVQPRMGKVLVFCESGNERSASLVVAYVMAMYSKDLVTAIQIVQAQRFAIAFDDSLRHLLSTYETILKAKRDVVQASRMQQGPDANTTGIAPVTPSNGSKRTFNEVGDDEDWGMVEADGSPNLRSPSWRGGAAPFQG